MTGAEIDHETRVLLLAPVGKDALLGQRVLGEAGIASTICPDLATLAQRAQAGAGVVLLTEEALSTSDPSPLTAVLERQPPWSDLPLIVLTRGGASSPTADRLLDTLGNVVLLERPVRISTLLSAVRTALRARGRQYQIREHLLERERVEEELEDRVRERTAQLEAAYRELETFSYSVSHDLRTPLRVIDGFGEALLEDYGDRLDDTARDYLRRIRGSTQRMSRLIDDLLNLSQVSRRKVIIQPVDLSALARASFEALRKDEQGHQVAFVCPPTLPADGDPGLLQILFDNLITNAWKFSGNRKRARIELGLQDSLKEQDGPDERVYFVRDNGAGFNMAHVGNLFKPFERLHSEAEFGGTGIGLATVQRIVERHGGRIWAEAEVDKGASFFFTLG